MVHEGKNVTYQYLCNVTASASDGVTTIDALPAGSAMLVTQEGLVKTGAISGATKYRIAKKHADGTVVYSPFFSYNDILSVTKLAGAESREQVTVVGASAATTITGIGTATALNTYTIDLTLLSTIPGYNTTPLIKTIPYMALSGATQQTVVTGLMDAGIRILNRGISIPYVRVDRVATGDTNTQAALTGSGTVYKLTKNSKTVAAYVGDATAGLTASTASVTVNNILSIPSYNGRTFTFSAVALGTGAGRHVVTIADQIYNVADAGTDAQNATAIVAAINAGTVATATAATAAITVTLRPGVVSCTPVVLSTDDDATWAIVAVANASGETLSTKYVVTATTSAAATFELDQPWQGETCYAAEGTTVGVHIGVYTIGANPLWGLKFTAIKQDFDAINLDYTKIRFNVNPKNNPYGTSTTIGFDSGVNVFTSVTASEGSGTYEQVAQQEIYSQFNSKESFVSSMPRTKYTTDTDATKALYDQIVVHCKNADLYNIVGQNPAAQFHIILPIARSLSYEAFDTNFGV